MKKAIPTEIRITIATFKVIGVILGVVAFVVTTGFKTARWAWTKTAHCRQYLRVRRFVMDKLAAAQKAVRTAKTHEEETEARSLLEEARRLEREWLGLAAASPEGAKALCGQLAVA